MQSMCDLRNATSVSPPRYSLEIVEVRGDESLICDPRSNMRSTEFVEQKLQVAMHCNRPQSNCLLSEEDAPDACETELWG